MLEVAPGAPAAPTAPAAAGVAFGVYVHWPFCRSKCPYCDFNSHVRERIDEAAWGSALLAELGHFARETRGRRVSSVFFGGGTPSLMDAATVGAVLDRIAGLWSVEPGCEVTLEANPNSAEQRKFEEFRAAGVNRVSLGVQALDDAALRFLGRGHDAAEARTAIALAARVFDRYSFDLIYARPGQGPAEWRAELGKAIALAGDHLSVYQLTIEPGTAFAGAHARGAFALPDEDVAALLYETSEEMLGAAGLPAYEVSNHARPGGECRHNLLYWRYGEYVGAGPGAHGRLVGAEGRIATRQHKAPETWLTAVAAHGHGTAERSVLAPAEAAEEAAMMGMRLAEGIDRARFRAATGVEIDAALDPARVAGLVAGGMLMADPTGLRATATGRRVLNAVVARLLG